MRDRSLRVFFALLFALLLVPAVLFLASAGQAFAAGPIPVGTAPYTILANPVDHEAYVANFFSDNITVIDSTNDTVTATITVGPPAPGGLSVPVSLAHNPNTGKLYCVNYWSGQLLTIDMATKSIENTIGIGSGHVNPRAVVVNPDTDLVYFSSLGQGRVYAVEGDTADPDYNSIIATITVGSYPRSLAVNTTLGRLYVANTSSGTISVVDIDPLSATFHQVVATITVGAEPYALAFNHSSGKLYATNRASNDVSVIDAVTDSRVATVTVGTYPRALDVNPETNLVYVANRDSSDISVIDGSSDTVTRTVAGGTRPYAVACIKTLTGNTYVANNNTAPETGTVTGIDASFATSETTVGMAPGSLSIDTLLAKPKVFVGNYADNNVSVIDPPAGESSLVTAIDPLPGDRTDTATPTITGSSTSLASPLPRKIMNVYYLIDSTDGRWSRARITSGAGTPAVNWEIGVVPPLAPGSHTIRVFAMDVTGATVTSSDGFAAGAPFTGQIETYSFEFAEPGPVLGSVSGVVFADADADGTRDAGDTAMIGKAVVLFGPGGSIAVTRTGPDGRYAFGELAAGAYTVRCPFSTRWRATRPSSASMTILAGQNATADFGAICYGWVSGQVTDLYTHRPYRNFLIKLWPTRRTVRTSPRGWYAFGRLIPSRTALMPMSGYIVTLVLPRTYRAYGGRQRLVAVHQGARTRVNFRVYRTATSH